MKSKFTQAILYYATGIVTSLMNPESLLPPDSPLLDETMLKAVLLWGQIITVFGAGLFGTIKAYLSLKEQLRKRKKQDVQV